MNLFVTVGSTKFDKLIELIGENIDILIEKGYNDIVVQYGNSKYPKINNQKIKNIDCFPFTNDPCSFINNSDFVISHSGAGTVLDVLRSKKCPKLLIVANSDLMDNHQRELAMELKRNNYCYSSDIREFREQLISCIANDSNGNGKHHHALNKLPDPIDPQILFNKLFSEKH